MLSVKSLKYTLITCMVVSLLWSLLLIAIGAIVSGSQAMLVNRFVSDVAKDSKAATFNDGYSTSFKGGINLVPVSDSINDDLSFGKWVGTLGAIIIMVGFIVFLYSVFGIITALSDKKPMLAGLSLAMIVAIASEVALVLTQRSPDSGFNKEAREEMEAILKKSYRFNNEKSSFSLAMNGIMRELKCCGISGPDDFSPNISVIIRHHDNQPSKFPAYFSVPPACCHKKYYEQGLEELVSCAFEGSGSSYEVYTQGCFDAFWEYVAANKGSTVYGILVFLIIWQVASIAVSVALFMQPPELREMTRETESEAVLEGGEKQHHYTVGGAFVPYSKKSSDVDEHNINSIRSTEIW